MTDAAHVAPRSRGTARLDDAASAAVTIRDLTRTQRVRSRVDRLSRACMIGATVGFAPFLLVLWDFGLRPLRAAVVTGVNSDFFELQARALFDGRLDVPAGSLGIEAFVVDGRHYMYFGPFPALLRMPVLLVTDRLDGRLTALSMLAGWVVLAVVVVALVRQVRHRLRGDAISGHRPDPAVSRLEAFGLGAVVASVLGGSTLVYLASQPWVYHEVYVWTTALALATAWSLIAAWDDPTPRRALVTAALATATILTRLPAGWAMATALVATGVWFVAVRARRDGAAWRRGGWGLVAAGIGAIAVGTAVNWAKFGHAYRFPIGDQVWTRHSAHRRLVLGLNGGDLDAPQFLPTTLAAYFRPDGVRFTGIFPFVTAPAEPPPAVGGVLLDDSMRTASVTAAMPLLLVLSVFGLIAVFRRGAPPGAAALRLPLAGTAAMTGAVLGFGHVAQRYTAEFLPLLALAGIAGMVAVAGRMRSASGSVRRGVVAAVAVLAAYGVVTNAAIGVANSRQNWRGERLADFVAMQLAISDVTGRPLDGYVLTVDELAAAGNADELAIVGDCAALYVGTGETRVPWVPVEFRTTTFRLAAGDQRLRPGSISLMWFAGHTVRRLHVQVNLDGESRLVMIGAPPDRSGHWLPVDPGDTITVTVAGDTAANRFVATAKVEGADSGVSRVVAPMTEWNRQFRGEQVTPHVALGDAAVARRTGVDVEVEPGPVPTLCDRLRS